MKVALKPLHDHLTGEESRLAAKFPHLATPLATLRERSQTRLAGESMTFDSVQNALVAMINDAEELDTDGYMFAIAQQLTNQLDTLARTALSTGVPVFPVLSVALEPKTQQIESRGETPDADPGYRTKLGGKPRWIQSDATPICRRCEQAMTFVAQIDSIAKQDTELGRWLATKDSFNFADVGMIYVFWCSKCNATESLLQCG